jgi:hypothetical protein
MTLTADNALFGHTDEATAYVVEDYPYGFRLRCQKRYWIETTKKGDRLCTQTTDPKRSYLHWNKAKKSTYVEVGCMFLNDDDHVTWAALNMWAKPEAIQGFVDIVADHLSDAQKSQIAVIKGYNRAFEDVTWTVTSGARTPEQETRQAATESYIMRRVAIETHAAMNEPLTTTESVERLSALSESLGANDGD